MIIYTYTYSKIMMQVHYIVAITETSNIVDNNIIMTTSNTKYTYIDICVLVGFIYKTFNCISLIKHIKKCWSIP